MALALGARDGHLRHVSTEPQPGHAAAGQASVCEYGCSCAVSELTAEGKDGLIAGQQPGD